MNLNERYHKTLIAVRDTIRKAEVQGLETEVIATAMTSLEDSPTLTTENALEDSLQEWDI